MNSDFFAKNRQKVMEKLRGGVLVVSAYSEMQRGNDAAFKFEQESNFWYLTGIEHPDWLLIMDASRGRSWLVEPEVDEVQAIFDGSLPATEATGLSGIKDVLTKSEGDDFLKQSAVKHKLAYTIGLPPYHEMFSFHLNPGPKELMAKLDRTFSSVQDFRDKLAEIRAIKEPEEIKAIQSAIDLTSKSFTNIYDKLSEYKYEYQVEADFTRDFRFAGAEGHAYDPIIAGGKNACTLHYGKNSEKLKKGTFLLMDVGARYKGYAADITRTYALGNPTKRMRAVHAAVLTAQKEIITFIRPGLDTTAYQEKVDEIMSRELSGLGLGANNFPHAISHGLGVDVHDSLGKPKTFLPGMVLTVEPGIYISEEGIGVRIEDDILVTESGNKNLSGKLSADL